MDSGSDVHDDNISTYCCSPCAKCNVKMNDCVQKNDFEQSSDFVDDNFTI